MPFVILVIVVLLLAGSLMLWAAALARLRQGQPLLEREPHRRVNWGLGDVIVAALAFLVPQIVAGVVLQNAAGVSTGDDRTINDYLLVMATSAVCMVLTVIIVWTWLRLRGASARDLGVSWPDVARDIVLGAAAFIMLAPIVFGIQMVLVLIVGPTKHPFILLLQKTPDLRLFLATSVNAVLLAPIVEELLFRGVLQGWLQSLRSGMSFDEVLIGAERDGMTPPPAPRTESSLESLAVADPANPYRAPALDGTSETLIVAELVDTPAPSPSRLVAWLPILGSSVLFSLAHYSHGPDWVPLLVLAMGLGYLFQRTHRLVPCMTVHFLLNLTSMGLLYLQLFVQS